MSFLLDTDTCSAVMRLHPIAFNRHVQYSGRLHISQITLAELYASAYCGRRTRATLATVAWFLGDVHILEFDAVCAETFGKLRGALKPIGRVVPHMDLLIAATALVHNLTMVTRNTRHFAMVPGLAVADWMVP